MSSAQKNLLKKTIQDIDEFQARQESIWEEEPREHQPFYKLGAYHSFLESLKTRIEILSEMKEEVG